MNNQRILLISFIVLLLLSGCGYPTITLRVLDEQTKEPIEGAVAIAWWTTSHGLPGLTYHKTARVNEIVSGPAIPVMTPGALLHSEIPPRFA